MGDERPLVVSTCREEKCESKGYCYDKDIINNTYLNLNRPFNKLCLVVCLKICIELITISSAAVHSLLAAVRNLLAAVRSHLAAVRIPPGSFGSSLFGYLCTPLLLLSYLPDPLCILTFPLCLLR